MKFSISLMWILLLLLSCNLNDKKIQNQISEANNFNQKNIIILNDTIIVSSFDTITKKTGDSENGEIRMLNEFQFKVVNYKNGWISSSKIFSRDSILLKKVNYRKGKLNGDYEEWYQNASPKIQGFYSDGLKDKFWTYYYSNGKIDSRGRYNSNKTIENFEQKIKSYEPASYEQSTLITKNLSHSSLDGEWEFYSFSGELIKTMKFKNGLIISMEFGYFQE